MVPLEWVNLQWNFPQLGFKLPASHKGSGRFLWTRTTLGLFVESFKHFILLQYARKSGERLFCRDEQSHAPAVCDMQQASHLEGNGEPHEHGLHASSESHAVLGPVCSQTAIFFQKMMSPVENHIHVNASRKGSSGWKGWRAPRGQQMHMACSRTTRVVFSSCEPWFCHQCVWGLVDVLFVECLQFCLTAGNAGKC